MFTGLIEDVGRVVSAHATEHHTQLQIAAPRTAKQVRRGESIAVNGCCLTLTSRRGDRLTFDLLKQTIARTNLKTLLPNRRGHSEGALPGGRARRRGFCFSRRDLPSSNL